MNFSPDVVLTVSVATKQFVSFYFSTKFNTEGFARPHFRLDRTLWQTQYKTGV